MIGWNTNTRILKYFGDEIGKTAGCAACVSPRGKKHSVACLSRQEEWKTKTIPQSERMTHGTDTEIQQDTQAPASNSTIHTPMTDIRDTDQPETGNDECENPGEWTPAKRILLKTSGTSEQAERDALLILNSWKVTSCREREQAAVQTREKVTSWKRRHRKNRGLMTLRWIKDHKMQA